MSTYSMKSKVEFKWDIKQKVAHETSSGCSKPDTRIMNYVVTLCCVVTDAWGDKSRYGSFELYSDCGEYYAEGGLWINLCEDGWELVDYDGVFELPDEIKKKLINEGISVD